MSVTFRLATSEDAGSITEVFLAARHTFLGYLPLVHPDDETRDWIANVLVPSQTVTVAEDGGHIVGMMGIERASDGIGWIEHLYLAPSHVGQGIGTRLVAQAKAELGSPICLYTFQANQGARRFYERHGFVPLQFGDGSGNEENAPDVLYEWKG